MFKIKSWLVGTMSVAVLTSCSTYDDVEIRNIERGIGYVATEFITQASLKEFTMTSPVAIKNAGKVLLSGRYLLIGEDKKGIHVYDNINPQNPVALAFIKIPAITDFLLQNNTLIVSNGDDLVSINVEAINEIAVRGALPESISTNRTFFSETKRLEKVFTFPNYPEQRGTYFECSDSLIYVTEWKLDSNLTNPTCYR